MTIERGNEESRKHSFVSMDFLVPENVPAKRKAYGNVASQKKTVDLDSIFQHIESSQNQFVELLAEGVAIAGVSAEPKRRQEVIRMVGYMETYARKGKNACLQDYARIQKKRKQSTTGKILYLCHPFCWRSLAMTPKKRLS